MNKVWNVSKLADGDAEITLYGTVGGGGFFSDGVSAGDFSADLADLGDVSKINVRINSPGGDVFDGIAIYNMLRAHGAEIVCRVEGFAASAASIVAMAGTVHMMRGSLLMVHNPWGMAVGEADELRDTADLLDKIRDALVPIYEAKTGKTADEIKALLDAETWMDPTEAVAAGFADEIDDDEIEVEAANDAADVMVQAVAYARADVPAPILAMAKTPPPPAEPDPDPEVVDQVDPDPDLDLDPMINAAFDDGKAEGITEERARIKACYDLLGKAGAGHDALAVKALFSEPMQPADLAVAIIDSEQHQSQVALAAAKLDAPTIGDSTDPNTIAAASLPVGDSINQSKDLARSGAAAVNALRGV